MAQRRQQRKKEATTKRTADVVVGNPRKKQAVQGTSSPDVLPVVTSEEYEGALPCEPSSVQYCFQLNETFGVIASAETTAAAMTPCSTEDPGPELKEALAFQAGLMSTAALPTLPTLPQNYWGVLQHLLGVIGQQNEMLRRAAVGPLPMVSAPPCSHIDSHSAPPPLLRR